jgi:uncharacterized protein with von Willebrand factor type A (vWA) domain
LTTYDWLCEFIGGGSNLDVPVREMPRYYRQLRAPVGRTDLLFVTDAQCHIQADVKQRFVQWKHSVQARLTTLVIGSQPGDLAQVSEECHTVQALSATEEAVGRALSI